MIDRKAMETGSNHFVHQITVIGRSEDTLIECSEKETLFEAMTRQGIYISAACGGRGSCGSCKVRLLKGELGVTQFDKIKFSQEEIKEGYRLSCKAYPAGDCVIQIISGEEADFEVVAERQKTSAYQQKEEDSYGIGIDIGTTTIAISLIEIHRKELLNTYTVVNKQRAYGADVISRMEASNNGKLTELQESIQKDLLSGIQSVVGKTGIRKERIEKLAIAGNTTMGHLLLGYSCKTLGSYPFTPVNIATTILSFEEVFASDYLKVPVVMLPGISTYVGADIVSGLFQCNFDKAEAVKLLIDLGTNGEMAIGNKDRLLVSSTAAGPAFEGGNISCGVGSIAGAICSINLSDRLSYHTIGDKAPVGICGTGVIELVSEFVKAGVVDETGLLAEEYFEEGYKLAEDPEGKDIVFTQRDVRELQLAKAAVRAGIEILIRRYGTTYQNIDTIYLAGGFGYKMNIEKAIEVGLLPKELSGKIKAIGNSSLQGAVNYLTEVGAQERMKHIIDISNEITLSSDMDFNHLYIGYLNFE